MRLLRERDLLRLNVHPAYDRHAPHAHRAPDALELLRYLERELARRRDHAREQALRVVPQPLQNWQRERSGLARPSGGHANDIAALERVWKDLGLDVCRGFEPHLLEGFEEGVDEAERFKGRRGRSRLFLWFQGRAGGRRFFRRWHFGDRLEGEEDRVEVVEGKGLRAPSNIFQA